ncbi:angiogenic factor with G patch and FHA domains 1 [Leptopilina heterotoma]|uniref:angiogenic factor with G patch and FHA domains 1 n=1 Tax=Leptopilina heterotoma TaxID=63436 RepID=UPI001CA7DFB2|nr:angiogenic factor with G patch and FHA domains 1 [Leptopilina heterotoma]
MTTVNKIVSDTADINESYEEDLELKEDIILELNQFPHVLKFMQKCQLRIKEQKSLIAKLQKEIIKLQGQQLILKKSFTNSETQTSFSDGDGSRNEITKIWNSTAEDNPTNFVDEIKKVAELAVQQTGFVYEETTGLYYDYNTGYYYDAKMGLYYDGNSGIYYYYDEQSNSYKFHSQAYIEKADEQNKELKESTKRKLRKLKRNRSNKHRMISEDYQSNEHEEGECSESDSSCSSQEAESTQFTSDENDDDDDRDLAKTYPPCMRIVVKETNLSKLKLGTLFLIPYTGGSIGREGNHNVLIQDINISKHHARFQYNEEKKLYEIIDLGSRNGTILNNVRMSVAKQESDPFEVIHGSILQVGCTKLLCHVHEGYETCENCEPGLLLANSTINETCISKIQQYKSELRRLKSKFGVESSNDVAASNVAVGYQDRAQARRQCNGSSDQYAKTEQTSLESSIAKDNKGFKLLSRMGWSEGQSLGKEGSGILEPVPIMQNSSKSGLGYKDCNPIPLDENVSTKKKQKLLQKMQDRYSKLSN